MSLKGDIHHIRKEIEAFAKGYGLDFFETIFELVDDHELNEIASYGGFPTRYPHWRFGMEYDHLCKGYEYGLQKIYEMVINNDPCYAYLMRSNSLVDQKIVIAHVYAHSDFFKNNRFFKDTNRKMMDRMANHAVNIRSYGEQFGYDAVESFIDECLSLENLIDVYHPYEFLHEKKQFKNLKEKEVPKNIPTDIQRPLKEKDILGFLVEHAPLEEWQKEILLMLREEAYYFMPQAQTKIMNEGWASFWHSKILTEKILKDAEIIDFADHHSGTLASQPGNINPYKLGIEIFRDIEERWNKGKFGEEYELCNDNDLKKQWDKKCGDGFKKVFEVRKLYNDVTFVDEFLTQELCERLKLFVYAYNKRNGTYEIVDRDTQKVKEKLLFSLANFGQPFIYAVDENYEGKGSLLLLHDHQGVDLKLTDTKETLERLQKIWKKHVCLETVINGERRMLTFDGKEHQERTL